MRTRKKVKQTKADLVFSTFIYIILILAGICTLFPFLDVVLTSITPTEEIVKGAKNLITIPYFQAVRWCWW